MTEAQAILANLDFLPSNIMKVNSGIMGLIVIRAQAICHGLNITMMLELLSLHKVFYFR
jgi:hypothetical protein